METVERRPADNSLRTPETYELTASDGRPVRVVGAEVGEVLTREGIRIRVFRSVSGRRVLHRTIDTCWGGYGDVVVVEGLDDERLTQLLGFGDDALGVYEALGVDPVRVLD